MAQVTDFSASQVPVMLNDLENHWEDARANQNRRYTADTQVLEGVFSEQTANLAAELTENDGCNPVKVVWMENGDHVVEDIQNQTAAVKTSVTCEIDGPTAASSIVSYIIDDFLRVTLKVKDKDCGNHFTRDNQFLHLYQSKLVDLKNALAMKMVLFMAAQSGVSLTKGQIGTYAGSGVTDTEKSTVRVAPGNFNAFDFAPFVAELAEFNRFFSPAVYDGGNLRYAQFNADYQRGTPAGDAGQANHFDTLRAIYRDGLNFAKASLQNSTFIVDQGALALFTAAFFPAVETDVVGNGFAYTQYRTPIPGLTQAFGRTMEADTTYKKEMLPVSPNSAVCELFHVWEMRLWYLPLANPLLSANDGVTGVIRVTKDATLTQVGAAMQKPL